MSSDLKRNIGVSKSISEGVILKKMNEIKVKKARDLKEGDELIKQKHGGWIVDSINVVNEEIQITIKYGSSAYLGLRLSKNDEVKVITKGEKE